MGDLCEHMLQTLNVFFIKQLFLLQTPDVLLGNNSLSLEKVLKLKPPDSAFDTGYDSTAFLY